MPPVAEGDGDGRKLRLALEVDLVYIIHDPHLAEALTRRKGRDEPAVLRQEQRQPVVDLLIFQQLQHFL